METVRLEEEKVKQSKEELQTARAQLKPIDNRLDTIKQHATKSEDKLSRLVYFYLKIFIFNFFQKPNQLSNSTKINELMMSLSLVEKVFLKFFLENFQLNQNSAQYTDIKRRYNDWEQEKERSQQELENVLNILNIEREDNVCFFLFDKKNLFFQQLNLEFEQKTQKLKETKQNLRKWEDDLNKELQQINNRKTGNFFMFFVFKFLELQRRIVNQKRLMERKIQGLSHDARNRGVVNAWDYYEKNRELFRYPVYVPYLHSNFF